MEEMKSSTTVNGLNFSLKDRRCQIGLKQLKLKPKPRYMMLKKIN